MNTWQCQFGRITVFPSVASAAHLPSAPNLYTKFWSQDPSSFQKQGQVSVAQGIFSGMVAGCSVSPLRLDIQLSPQQTDVVVDTIPAIADPKALHQELKRISETISNDSSFAAHRVACVVQFACTCANFEEANKIICSALPQKYHVNLDKEEDFILQVNRLARLSEGVDMNFITKWAVERVQVVSLPVTGAGAIGPQLGEPLVKSLIAATILFDNSNRPSGEPLSKADRSAILIAALQKISEGRLESKLNVEGF
jgi:hypothetical protein